MTHHNFPALDGMRAVAALVVVALHADICFGGNRPGGVEHLAVDFFFCLSGFVLFAAYGEALRSGRLVGKDYILLRLIRLYPMIVAGILLGSVTAIGSFGLVRHLCLTFGAILLLPVGLESHGVAFLFDAPLWSLFFEITVSLALPAIILLHPRALLACAVVSGALLIWGVIGHGTLDGLGFKGIRGFLFGFPRFALPFSTGILIAQQKARLGPWDNPLPAFAVLVGVLMLPADPATEALVAILVVPGLVILGARARTSRSDALFELGGALSYLLYAIHWPLFSLLSLVGLKRGGFSEIVAIVLALAVSWLAWRFYDEPIRDWLKIRFVTPTRAKVPSLTF